MTNLRLACRTLLKTPVVSAVAVVSLALGIGSNAAIFSLFNQVLLRPLPVSHPASLVNLAAPGPKPGSDSCNNAGGCDEVFSYPMFRDLQREQTVFTDLVAHRSFGINVGYRGRTLSGEGMGVSGSYFPTLGLTPAAGRLFGPEVDTPIGGHSVAVLGYDFWQNELAGTPNVIGDALIVNGEPLTVIGVAPDGFRGTTISTRPVLFVPLTMGDMVSGSLERFDNRTNYWLYLFGRLEPDVSLTQARVRLEPRYQNILSSVEAPLQTNMSDATMARFISKPLPMEDGRRGQSSLAEDATAPLLLLFAVTGIVILIACANVANLLLARAASRASEMAIRLSVGALRRHLLAQLLTESCLLSFVAGLAGLVVAQWTLRAISWFLPPQASNVLQLSLDPGAMVFTLGLSLVTGILFGLFPALHNTRSELVSTLKDQAGQAGGARHAALFRHSLVMAQVALSMTLLVAAGLFIQSLRNVSRVELGIETHNIVTFRVAPALSGYEDAQSQALYDRLASQLAAQPGVSSVTGATVAVFAGNSWGSSVMVEGFAAGPDTDRSTRINRVGTDYFRTLGVATLAGRDFNEADTADTPEVAIVNEAFAAKFELGREAVGKRLGQGGLDAALDVEIVGLVRNTKYNDVKNTEPPLLYTPYRQASSVGNLTFYARSSIPPSGLLRAIPRIVNELDSNLPVNDLKTLTQQVRENIFLERMISVLSASFAGLATLLAAVGLYGVLAYTVTQRTREIGLRMALGADAARVRTMILGQVGRMTLVGGLVGLVAAVGLARLAQSLMYEVEGLQPVILTLSSVGLFVVACAAGLVPAQRAASINPMTALRSK